jgi:hypothetical protein
MSTVQMESAGFIAGSLRRSCVTWADTDCTFSECAPTCLFHYPVISNRLPPQYEGTLRLFTAPAGHAETLSRSWAPLLLAGGAAGILGWLGTFPFDVIKTRMQAQDIVVGDVARTSSFWCAVRGLSAEAVATGAGRVRVFWRGFVPTVVRAVPVNMAVFGTFEGIVWAFS